MIKKSNNYKYKKNLKIKNIEDEINKFYLFILI